MFINQNKIIMTTISKASRFASFASAKDAKFAKLMLNKQYISSIDIIAKKPFFSDVKYNVIVTMGYEKEHIMGGFLFFMGGGSAKHRFSLETLEKAEELVKELIDN